MNGVDARGNGASKRGRSADVVIGTRGSALALAQTELVRAALCARYGGLTVETVRITTKGDVILDRPLSAIGDKGLFVTEIEQALRERRIDMAVHSAKDLPAVLPPDMWIAAFPLRAEPRDRFLSREYQRLVDMPRGSRIGTSSLRRACQVRHMRSDVEVVDLRGNVDTRLRRLRDGDFDAVILAAAGLERLSVTGYAGELFSVLQMMPAVGQGALAIEVRAEDVAMASLLAPLDDAATRAAVEAERMFLQCVNVGCQFPVGAYARVSDETLVLDGLIGSYDGHVVRCGVYGPVRDGLSLGQNLAGVLLEGGGSELLARA